MAEQPQDLRPTQPSGVAVTDQPTSQPQFRMLDPRVRPLWWTISTFVLLGTLLVAWGLGRLLDDGWGGLPPLFVFVVGVPLAVALPALRYRRWRFALRDHDLWIRRGVLWLNTSVIPYARLQFVDTTQGPLDRLFGLAQLIVHTAAPGTSGRLPGLAAAEAESLRERLARVDVSEHDV
jgi:uncharacterized protein